MHTFSDFFIFFVTRSRSFLFFWCVWEIKHLPYHLRSSPLLGIHSCHPSRPVITTRVKSCHLINWYQPHNIPFKIADTRNSYSNSSFYAIKNELSPWSLSLWRKKATNQYTLVYNINCGVTQTDQVIKTYEVIPIRWNLSLIQ